MKFILQSISKSFTSRFKRYTFIIALAVFALFLFNSSTDREFNEDRSIHFFYQSSCEPCLAEQNFLEKLQIEFPGLEIISHDLAIQEQYERLDAYLLSHPEKIKVPRLPVTIIGQEVVFGFAGEESSGIIIRESILALGLVAEDQGDALEISTIVDVPVLGKIDARKFSLPALAVILGLVDGLNPCAMWVLVYLISLVVNLKDRRRIWLLVGSFVLASGVLYFLFMAAWLNAFLLMGYARYITLAVGLFALWVGISGIYDWLTSHGPAACEVGDSEFREKTVSRIRKVVAAPLTIGSFAAIIALAFVVNSIEFLCSAAIPAVFTHILAISPLNTLQYYLYILLYDFFFMLDDMIIFATAAFAATSSLGEKYSTYTRPICAILMAAMGILLIFFPTILR